MYQPIVTSATDYFPFGMQMPGRTYNLADKYRYGFNGQEKEPELGTSFTTAEFWMYDGRLGRRWNQDPVPLVYESNYSTFGNNPIIYIDPDGDFRTKAGARLYNFTHGNKGTIGGNKKDGFIVISTNQTTTTIDGHTYDGTDINVVAGRNGNGYDKVGEKVESANDFINNTSFVASGDVKFSLGFQAEFKGKIGLNNQNSLGFKVGAGFRVIESNTFGAGVEGIHGWYGSKKSDQKFHNYFVGELGGKVFGYKLGVGYKGDYTKDYYNSYDKGPCGIDGTGHYDGNGYLFGKSWGENKLSLFPNFLEPSFKFKGGYENKATQDKTFYGVDFGAGAKLLLGVDVKLRVGFKH